MTGSSESRQVYSLGNFVHSLFARMFVEKKWTILEQNQPDYHGHYMIIGMNFEFVGIYESYMKCKEAMTQLELDCGCIIRCYKGLKVVSIFALHEKYVTEWEPYFESLTDLLMSLHWKAVCMKHVHE